MRKPSPKALEEMMKRVPLTDLNSEVDMRAFAAEAVPQAKEAVSRVKRILYEDTGKLTSKAVRTLYTHWQDNRAAWCMVPVSIALWLDLWARSLDERKIIAMRLITAIRNLRKVPPIGERALSLDTLSAFPPAVFKSVDANRPLYNVESICGIEALMGLLCFTLEGRQVYPEDVLDAALSDVSTQFAPMLMMPMRSALKSSMMAGKSATPMAETAPYRFLCRPEEFFGSMLLCTTKLEAGVQSILAQLEAVRKVKGRQRLGVATYPQALEKLLTVMLSTTAPTFRTASERARLYSRYALW